MDRKIERTLIEWKNMRQGRMPLLIYGARQVGKTYMIKEFAAREFDDYVYVNFEADNHIIPYFDNGISPEQVIHILEKFYGKKIIPEQTLIIFDEIQLCERALNSMKYFCEDAPEYHVVGAGSLLGVAINRERFSFPVGKVQIANMYPLDFEEFLWARGKSLLADTIRHHHDNSRAMPETLHEEAILEYEQYLICGGMPAGVFAYITENAQLTHGGIKELILSAYVADMAKYSGNIQSIKNSEVFQSIPAQLAKENHKFQYKYIKSGGRAAAYADSIEWLALSGIVLKCTKCEQGIMPFELFSDLGSFKLYMSDVGLLATRLGITNEKLAGGISAQFYGALAENYVATQLVANKRKLLYWESKNTAEVDFLIENQDGGIPVEVKSGENVRARSLSVFMNKYDSPYGIRISKKNFGFENQIKSVPLYSTFCI